MAPIFGFDSLMSYGVTSFSRMYEYLVPQSYLFSNLPETFQSQGYDNTLTPAESKWKQSLIPAAQIMAISDDSLGIVTLYHPANYYAIYITNMPEYHGDSLDAQFLYNAITYRNPSSINIEEDPLLRDYHLSQNYPNPFNPATTIQFNLPSADNVKLDIYNSAGQKIHSLLNNEFQAGAHSVSWNASGFASGVYYYTIQTGQFRHIRKMILLK